MFKKGDRVRYTGAYKNSYRYAPGWAACTDMTIVGASIHRTQRENSVVYVAGSIGRHEAVYAGDLELAAPAEPEPYEAWFVA